LTLRYCTRAKGGGETAAAAAAAAATVPMQMLQLHYAQRPSFFCSSSLHSMAALHVSLLCNLRRGVVAFCRVLSSFKTYIIFYNFLSDLIALLLSSCPAALVALCTPSMYTFLLLESSINLATYIAIHFLPILLRVATFDNM
jgi:hypothetical protein